jgi:hypothetical protein
MKNRVILFLILSLNFTLAGCVTHREFYGTGKNLNGGQEQNSAGSHLKMNVTCSGDTTNGGCYILFSLPKQHSMVVFFYPPLKSNEWLRAEIGTKLTHVWRTEAAQTNSSAKEVRNASYQTGAWFIEDKRFDYSRLTLGASQFNFPDAKCIRLYGQIEMGLRNDAEFEFNTDLCSDDRVTVLQGEFVSYKTLWRPLLLPAMLIFGDEGSNGPKFHHLSPQANVGSAIQPANIKITVNGNISHSGDYLVPEGTTIAKIVKIAGNLRDSSVSNIVHIIRKQNEEEETWELNYSNPMTGGFFLIQGDEIRIQAE